MCSRWNIRWLSNGATPSPLFFPFFLSLYFFANHFNAFDHFPLHLCVLADFLCARDAHCAMLPVFIRKVKFVLIQADADADAAAVVITTSNYSAKVMLQIDD